MIKKLLLASLFALPTMLPSAEAHASDTYKVKVSTSGTSKWKVKWQCQYPNGSYYTIDSDTYPASGNKTRETNVSRCNGSWKIHFLVEFGPGIWVEARPSSCSGNSPTAPFMECGYSKNFIDWGFRVGPEDFNASNKLCVKATSLALETITVTRKSC